MRRLLFWRVKQLSYSVMHTIWMMGCMVHSSCTLQQFEIFFQNYTHLTQLILSESHTPRIDTFHAAMGKLSQLSNLQLLSVQNPLLGHAKEDVVGALLNVLLHNTSLRSLELYVGQMEDVHYSQLIDMTQLSNIHITHKAPKHSLSGLHNFLKNTPCSDVSLRYMDTTPQQLNFSSLLPSLSLNTSIQRIRLSTRESESEPKDRILFLLTSCVTECKQLKSLFFEDLNNDDLSDTVVTEKDMFPIIQNTHTLQELSLYNNPIHHIKQNVTLYELLLSLPDNER